MSRELEQILLRRLGRAVKRFEKMEHLERDSGLEHSEEFNRWPESASLDEALGLINTFRERLADSRPALKFYWDSLAVCLTDLQMALANGHGERMEAAWTEEIMLARFSNSFFMARLEAGSNPARAPLKTPPETGRAVRPEELESLRLRTARRWMNELLPLAVGTVLNDNKVNLPSEMWELIARGKAHQALREVNLTRQARDMVEVLSSLMPQAQSLLQARFEQPLAQPPETWWQAKPSLEDAATIVKAMLYSHYSAAGPVRFHCGAVESKALDEPARRFREALKDLVLHGLEKRVAALNEQVARQMDAENITDLIKAIQDLTDQASPPVDLKGKLANMAAALHDKPSAQEDDDDLLARLILPLVADAFREAAKEKNISPDRQREEVERMVRDQEIDEDQAGAFTAHLDDQAETGGLK